MIKDVGQLGQRV